MESIHVGSKALHTPLEEPMWLPQLQCSGPFLLHSEAVEALLDNKVPPCCSARVDVTTWTTTTTLLSPVNDETTIVQ